METLTIDATRSGKPLNMQALRELYVETMVQAAEFNDALARRALGRSPAHVILLHETDLAALFISDLADELRKGGWTIITADEAYRDPLREAMPDVPSAQGTLTEAIAWEMGIPAPRWYERVGPRVADRIFEQRVLGPAKSSTASSGSSLNMCANPMRG